MIFKDPWILVFLSVVFILTAWSFKRTKKASASFRFPTMDLVKDIPVSFKVRLVPLVGLLRLIVLILFVIALAGPRSVLEETKHHSEGIDIVLALDCSGSMAAEDFTINGRRQNRLEVIKKVVEEFIEKRTSDRIGLVAFGAVAYTVCPLTTDYNWLKANLERIHLGIIEDGTAIGSGIASSLARLKNSKAKSKIVILLTDGINNAGRIDPITAAKTAQAMGIKVYTIGAGTKGFAPFPVQDVFGRQFYQEVRIDLDEKTLQEIARLSGGRYFRATDTEGLRGIYKEIDSLEKTEIETTGYKEYKELFVWFLTAALILFLLEILLTHTVLVKVP